MANYYDYIVTQDEAGTRLDRFIADKERKLSRSFVQKLISEGCVTVGDLQTKSSYNIRVGDVVKVRLPEPQSHTNPRAENIPLDIVFEDDELVVVSKPAGMVVHPAAGVRSGTLVNAILAHVQDARHEIQDTRQEEEVSGLGARVSSLESFKLNSIAPERPGIVHRIDKGTSGLIVVAKTVGAYYKLAAQFKEHSVRRKYVALVCSEPGQTSGTIVAPIGRSRRDRKKMAVTSVHSKEAVTHFSVTERYGGFSLIEIQPETGRTHQIRVHLAHIGYPVVGDPTYGGRSRALKSAVSQVVRTALQKLSRQALHAQTLGFIHPSTAEYMEFSAPIPEDIQNVIDALRNK
jgi:23S rRNA pseudouridine1911/1915/1917 synthase